MKSNLFILVCLIHFNAVYRFQNSGKVIDRDLKCPVPYATIIVFSGHKVNGFYCDSLGNYPINTEDQLTDSIKFSCAGYKSRTLTLKELTSNNFKVQLTPVALQLEEVIVTPCKETTIGSLKKLPMESASHSVSGVEFATYIANNGNSSFIKEILIRAKGNDSNKDIVRIHLYSVNKLTFEPDLDLLPKNFLITVSKDQLKNEIFNIDIEKYKIKFPLNGIFVSYEFIGTSKQGQVNINSRSSNIFALMNVPSNKKREVSLSRYNLEDKDWQKDPDRRHYQFGLKLNCL